MTMLEELESAETQWAHDTWVLGFLNSVSERIYKDGVTLSEAQLKKLEELHGRYVK